MVKKVISKKDYMTILYDLLMYLSFVPIYFLFTIIFFKTLNNFPVDSVTHLSTITTFEELYSNLVNLLVGIFGSFLLFILLNIFNVAAWKSAIWSRLLDKKLSMKIIWKSFASLLIVSPLFAVFVVVSFIPLMNGVIPSANTPPTISPESYIPIILLLFICIYIATLTVYFVVKTGKIFQAIKGLFVMGFSHFPSLSLPILIAYGIPILFFIISRQFTIFTSIVAIPLVIIILTSSYYSRTLLLGKLE